MRLIDADALMRDIEQYHLSNGKFQHWIELQPTVDAVPVRHGKWIYGNEFHWYTANCNKWGYKRSTDIKAHQWNQWKFCPNCGARMDEK